MAYKILNIDKYPKHREVLRHLIDHVFPDVELVEYDPVTLGRPADMNWAQ